MLTVRSIMVLFSLSTVAQVISGELLCIEVLLEPEVMEDTPTTITVVIAAIPRKDPSTPLPLLEGPMTVTEAIEIATATATATAVNSGPVQARKVMLGHQSSHRRMVDSIIRILQLDLIIAIVTGKFSTTHTNVI